MEDDEGAAEEGEDLVEHGEGHQDQRGEDHTPHQEGVPEPGGQQDPGVKHGVIQLCSGLEAN